MAEKYAVLMDGGFVKKKLSQKNRHFPTAAEVKAEVDRIQAHNRLAGKELLRVYFYDSPPAEKMLMNPVDGTRLDLSKQQSHSQNMSLQQSLELFPDFALRMGEMAVRGWKLGPAANKKLQENPRAPTANDFVPDISQKGVDLRIGLDIARLALKDFVDVIVVVTGDSDLVPAFKFARREGTRVFLDHMGHGVRRELKVHSDFVF
ncbi:NYN domain-containing protein [Tepidicaulis sp. LMO-SS28]|uniref:NYN domain-containing protein n=1 Tax=Tepidicaulis sp. LMO-SS28 TaxID=3447455 RepID=UPI003EE0BFC3